MAHHNLRAERIDQVPASYANFRLRLCDTLNCTTLGALGNGGTKALPKRDVKPALYLRIDFDNECSLGPDKVRLLELIEETGSISAAGRALGISYRPAWNVIDELNRIYDAPMVATQTGGINGGGAQLTEIGTAIIRIYREMEKNASNVTSKGLRNLTQLPG